MPPRIHIHKLNVQGYNFKINLKHKPEKDNPNDYILSWHSASIILERKERQDVLLLNHYVYAIIQDHLSPAMSMEQTGLARENIQQSNCLYKPYTKDT